MVGARDVRAGAAALGLLVLAAGLSWSDRAMADDDTAPRITSHSQDYCAHLTERLDALMFTAHLAPSAEVISLTEEGRRMCDAGHVRGGIARLRRAVLLLQQVADTR